jgi:chorismate mutase
MRMFGIRGATTVEENTEEKILERTHELLKALIAANDLCQEDVVSIIFTATPDLTAAFPAKACRMMGWTNTALLDAVEMDVPHGLSHCIRILMHAYREEKSAVKPIYLHGAVKLRPDLVQREE